MGKTLLLRRLLNRQQLMALFQDWSVLNPLPLTLGITDATGQWLAVHPNPIADDGLVRRVCSICEPANDESAAAWPIIVEDEFFGVLYIGPDIATIRTALQRVLVLLIQKEIMQKSLAQETLDRYREVNLLYRVHETIGASLDLDEVVQCVLDESVRIIKADGGAVFLPNDLNQLSAHHSIGLDDPADQAPLFAQSLAAQVFAIGKSQILNELPAAPLLQAAVQFGALLSSPLKSQENSLGVITLFRTNRDAMFTAGDEKLLMAIASQAGIAIANAQAVLERERRLERQIQALKIEIDEAKKQKEVANITESEYFKYLQENAQRLRSEFSI